MRRIISSAPMVAYRRPKNLKDLLVRATLEPSQQSYEGTCQCGRLHCKTCTHIEMGIRFSSAVTGEDFWARATANCKTSNIIHLIECQKCDKQYVGETKNPLHLRLNSHRSDYNRRLADKTSGKALNELGHTFSDLTIVRSPNVWLIKATHGHHGHVWLIKATHSYRTNGHGQCYPQEKLGVSGSIHSNH